MDRIRTGSHGLAAVRRHRLAQRVVFAVAVIISLGVGAAVPHLELYAR